MKNLIVILVFLISGLAMAQTTVTLQDQCNCEVLSGTAVTVAGMISPVGADIGDIYVNTNTGTIYFWDGGSWGLTSSDDQQLQNFSFDAGTHQLTLALENGGSLAVDLSVLNNAGTDDQNIEDLGLAGNILTVGIEDGTAQTVDLSALVGTDNQNIENLALAGNTLTVGIEDGTSQNVDLSSLIGTDDQAITTFSLDNATNILTITLEGGNTQTVDLSALNNTGTDDQNISGSGLSGTDLTIGIENGTNETVDLSSLVGTDDQAISLSGNTLTLEDGGTVDLTPYLDNTDDQAITDFSLDGTTNILTLTLEDGGTQTVDLSGFVSTDDQNLALTGNTLEIEDGNNVDLSGYLDNTDDQALSLSGNTITLEDGGTVDLTPYLDNTDDQAITDFSLDGTTNILTLTLEDGGTQTVDLSGFVSTDDQALSLSGNTLTLEDGGTVDLSSLVGTDDQALSLSGNTLTLEDGGTVDLSPYLDDTDNQTVTDFNLGAGDILTITLEDGNTRTVDLSSLNNSGTDDQIAAEVNYDNTVSGLAAAEVQSAIDELAAGSTDDQNISGSGLSGTDLTIGIENGTNEVVDLSSLANTDEQDLSSAVVTPNESVEIQINNGNNTTIDIRDADSDVTNELTLIGSGAPAVTPSNSGVTYVDEVAGQLYVYDGTVWNAVGGNASPDLDGDPTNERNTAFTVNAGNLEITDSGGTLSVPLSSLDTDDQTITAFSLDNASNVLTITLEDGNTQTVDLSSLDDAGTDDQNLTLSGTDLSIEDGNTVDLSGFVSTDDQQISLAGNILTLEDGGTVNLSGYLDNTDDQTITDFSIDNATDVLTLTLEDGGTQTVDLSALNNSGTDDQDLTGASLNGSNILQIDIEGGTSTTVDLSSLDNSGSDDQNLTLTGNTLSIEDGNNVDLAGYLDNTDAQNISGSGLSGTDLTIGIENGANEVVDLSGLVGTDDQTISLAGNILTLEDGGTVDLSGYFDNTDDQTVTDFGLDASNVLTITLEDGNTRTVDLSALDDAGTDDQDISTDGTAGNITIEDGSTLSLNVNDADSVVGNEYNTAVGTNAGSLELTDGGGTFSTSLISADANNDISAGTDGALYLNVASVTISETITDLTDTDDGFVTYVNENGATQKVAKADITDNGNGTYTFTNNDGSDVILDTRASSNTYDNSASGLTATNVQSAIDELSAESTDDQNLTLTGNTLSIQDGNSVDLAGYLDNTDDQNISGSGLSGTDLTIGIENGANETVDLSSLVGTDDQTISLSGNTLTLEDGGTVDLAPYLDNTDDQAIADFSLDGTTHVLTLTLEDGGTQTVDLSGFVSTDDQNIENLGLAGNILTVGIEGGTAQTVDLSALDDSGTDDQNLTGASLNGSNILQIDIEDGTSATVDLSALNDSGTDDQALSLSGNTLTLEDGGTVDLSPYLDNTDDQAITDFSLDGTTNILTLTLENGGTQTVDLSGFVSTDDQQLTLATNTLTLEDGGTVDLSGYLDNTDDQALSLSGNTLTLEDGGTVDLSAYLDDTDNQTVTDFSLGAGDVLTITLEDGNTRTVDLSSLNNTGTDDQTAAEVNYDNTVSGLAAAEVQSAIDELAAGSTDDQNISGSGLSGTDLTIGIENGTNEVVDLSSLVGTDDQDLTTDGTAGNISIEDGNSISLNVNDADSDPGNEYNTAIGTTTGNLEITDNGGTLSTSLISADANNDIAAGTDGALYLNVASVTISETITNLTDTNDGFVTYINESGATQKVAKANITDNGNGTYTFTNNDGSDVLLDTRASSNPYDNTTSGLTATDTQAALDELSAGSTDDQNLTLSGTDLSIEGGNSIDLSGFVSTDDQALTLSGNTLTLEDGGTVDLSGYLDNTDDQTVTAFAIDNATNVLTISLEDGNTRTVDLSVLDNSGTDDQQISLSGNTLTLEDGGTVDLSAYLDNTDNQAITDFSLDGATNILTLTLEDGGTQTVDLSGFVSSDDQQVSLAGNTLTLEDGGTVDLTPYLDNTDDQAITVFSLDGTTNILTLTLEDGGTQTVDLSGFVSTDDQNISGSGLTGTDLTIGIENGTNETVDLSSLVGTDDQTISLAGNILILEDGGTVDLSGYLDNTDDQNIENLGLGGNILTVGIEGGTAQTVDLSALDNSGTDDQNLIGASLNGSNILQIDIEDGTSATVDLSALNDSGTDDQALSLSGNTLTLEDGGTVDLSPYLDNTDDQAITDFSLDGTTNILTLTLEDGGTQTVDLSGFVSSDNQNIENLGVNTATNVLTVGIEDGTGQTVDLSHLDNSGTDDQALSLSGNTLTLEDGGTVDLSGYLDNTDDQNIENLGLAGNILTVGIEGGTAQTVDLSALDNSGTDDQNISGSGLSGTDLTIGIENGTNETVDLSSLVGTDDQQLSLATNTLTLEDGGTVDLAGYLDNTDDQNLTGASLNGSNILQIDIEDGTSATVDLSALNDSGTDDQKIDTFTLTGTTLNLSVEDDGEAPRTVNLNSFATDTELAASDAADLDKVIGNEVTNATNTTLTRSGSGTAGSPYTLGVSNGGIGTTQLATNAVTNSKIANNAVSTTKILSGGNNKIMTTGPTGTVIWQDIPTISDDQTASEVDSNVPVDIDGDGTTETTVEDVIQDIAPITSKAARIFYPPSIAVDASTTGTLRTLNLYTQYTAQFATPAVASAGAPAAIPTYAAGDLFYYVTYYDTSVFDNVSVDANGVMTYDVIAQPADYNSLINVVFVVK